MNNLRKELAPISSEAWEEIEKQAKEAILLTLSGRKMVDVKGPLGATAFGVGTGAFSKVAGVGEGVAARLREVLPLLEIKVPFSLSREELDAVELGLSNPDLSAVVAAARKVAKTEDDLVLAGLAGAKIEGLAKAAKHTVKISSDPVSILEGLAEAISFLKEEGISGPYALVLGAKQHKSLALSKDGETKHQGLYSKVSKLADGGIIVSHNFDGVMVVSKRGGDFELTLGQDISIGYASHDEKTVKLYFVESLTFRVLTPEAVVGFKSGK